MRTNTTTLIKIDRGIANNEIISSGGLPIADRAGLTEIRPKNDAEITKIAHAKSSKDRHAHADTSLGTLLPWTRYQAKSTAVIATITSSTPETKPTLHGSEPCV